jgi:hypothetical protein
VQQTRKYFSQDEIIDKVRTCLSSSLTRNQIPGGSQISTLDCLMSAVGMFTFKFPSMLQFDAAYKEKGPLAKNMHNLFKCSNVPCDTTMRERIDVVPSAVTRKCFTSMFAMLQRANLLDHFRFLEKYHLISIDGTGYFSSPSIHCDQCCVKEHKNGSKTYYHQMMSAALVHPDQKVVYPFAPEPILKQDGVEKNDCERNAAKRWLEDFRREHPHLATVIVADGLFSNNAFITLLKEYNMHYILVCQEKDHEYLLDWFNTADEHDSTSFEIMHGKVHGKYKYMLDVPLNGSCKTRVNVLGYEETKGGKTTKWMWVTNLEITKDNAYDIMKGGRSRWRIENETFNTLKNQGYEFEHNFGHGYEHLSTTLAHLMLLAFFVDQVLCAVNKRFLAALEHAHCKRVLWEYMRGILMTCICPSFEILYYAIVHPPGPIDLSTIL